MRVIKDRAVIEDGWELVPAGADVPATGDVIVDLARWNSGNSELLKREGRTGVVLSSSQTADQIQALESLPLVAIEFPKFGDGRGYSTARLLRERFGYQGELRAVGDVLRDQLFYMARCGIDSFALKSGKDAEGALQAFEEFSVTYQAGADDPRPLFRRVRR
jgi:uncharacterized protein (DUF934 family)